ncbi:hypothetical protein EC973_006334 [Apophysomyces ossiformis]|uniref:Uncharacterized protein n=1 Tax=Apophysomyces ossiformis TaxID=679940 RepID=A0A8H7EUH5_9FUNG|nr:hypothetical protein EC973_006334 [Apophysomyces ossiformis]
MVQDEPKKFAVGETHKKHGRHHVKRKSAGRVHVTKLAPMARAAENDENGNNHNNNERKPMRRSQSQRSLHRLSADRKLMTMTPSEQPPPPSSPPPSPSPSVSSPAIMHKKQEEGQEEAQRKKKQETKEEMQVIEKEETQEEEEKKQTILKKQQQQHQQQQQQQSKQQPPSCHRSEEQRPKTMGNVAAVATAQSTGLSRTQQKLMLQREHTFVDDENNLAHPRNMIRLTRELERMGREYQCVKRFRDPMVESLMRCMDQRKSSSSSSSSSTPSSSSGHPTAPSIVPSASQSESTLSTGSSFTTGQPHWEHRQASRRRHLQLLLEHQKSQAAAQSNTGGIRWSAGAFLDRMLNG